MDDAYDIAVQDGETFRMISGLKRLKASLIERFPEEEMGIHQYFENIFPILLLQSIGLIGIAAQKSLTGFINRLTGQF